MDFATAIRVALGVPHDSPEQRMASDVCLLRGINPDADYEAGGSRLAMPVAVKNWQLVIAEQAILLTLAEQMMS